MVQGVPRVDHFIRMDWKAFWLYLGLGLLIFLGAAIVIDITFSAPVEGTPDLVLKAAGFVVATPGLLSFEKCYARYERIRTLQVLRRECQELAADPSAAQSSVARIESMIERLFEKRLLG